MMKSFDQALGTLEQWARERSIEANGTVEGQAKKTIEEAGEILDALRYREWAKREVEAAADETRYKYASECKAKAIRELEDALGDTGVAWIMCCICAGRDPVEMLGKAIIEIRDRRGHMGEDGIFHKNTGEQMAERKADLNDAISCIRGGCYVIDERDDRPGKWLEVLSVSATHVKVAENTGDNKYRSIPIESVSTTIPF